MSVSRAGESERDLLVRVTSGQAGAWDDLVDRYIGLVYHALDHSAQAQGVRLSPRETEDMCAEVFGGLLVSGLEAVRNFAWGSNFETWLTVRARRHFVWRLQQKLLGDKMAASPTPKPQPTEDEPTEAKPADPPQASRPATDLSDVGRRMDGLPWLEAQVVRMRYIDNRTDDEIAKLLDVPVERVPDLLRRAEQYRSDHDEARTGKDQP